MGRLRGTFAVLGIAVGLALSASAQAAQQIGQTGSTVTNCGPDVPYVQTALSGGPSYSPSAYGVITSWSHMGDPAETRTARLLVLRHNPSGGLTHFIATAKDQVRTTLPNQLNTYTSGVRLPIETNERLGIFIPPGQPVMSGTCAFTAPAGDRVNWPNTLGDPPLNTSLDYPNNGAFNLRLNASALVEPDADRDIFGDETQDNCLGTAGTVGGCPNTLSLGKATAKGNKVTVTATVPGAGTVKGGSATDMTLALTAAKKKKKKKARPPLKQASQTLTSKASQSVTLTLPLSKTGRKKLAEKGKLKLRVKVTYTPVGGTPGSATAKAKLRRKKKG